jgi:hypothetical protein
LVEQVLHQAELFVQLLEDVLVLHLQLLAVVAQLAVRELDPFYLLIQYLDVLLIIP